MGLYILYKVSLECQNDSLAVLKESLFSCSHRADIVKNKKRLNRPVTIFTTSVEFTTLLGLSCISVKNGKKMTLKLGMSTHLFGLKWG